MCEIFFLDSSSTRLPSLFHTREEILRDLRLNVVDHGVVNEPSDVVPGGLYVVLLDIGVRRGGRPPG